MAMIKFTVEDAHGRRQEIEVPDDMNLNLMEIMKANEIPVMATCGGMALCATCHVEVLEGIEKLKEPSDAELDMIDTLPIIYDNSRLACQLRINEQIEGAVIRFAGEEE